jgi:chromosome segregation ATPase
MSPKTTKQIVSEDATPVAELIARFQLETEALIATLRNDHQRQIVEQERKVAALSDEWTNTRAEVKALREGIEAAVHEIQTSMREAINAQREAVKAAQKAADAAAVFDKLKASQPDFHRIVGEQNKTVARLSDTVTHLGEQLQGLAKQIDAFEVLAEDYEETKGEVRGLDLVVKDLNTEARNRRKQGVMT